MTNQTDARREQARGNGVAHAGQFGHQTHSEPGAFDAGIEEAAGQAPTQSVALDVQLNCFGLPSSRHRNAQWFRVPGVLSVEAPVVAVEDAPRALTITPKEGGRTRSAETYVVHDGQLYRRTGKDLEASVRSHSSIRNPYAYEEHQEHQIVAEHEVEHIQRDVADNWIVVDGIVHERQSQEPLLTVRSWGVDLEPSWSDGVDARGFIVDRDAYTLSEWEAAQADFDRRRKRRLGGGEDRGIAVDAGDGLSDFTSGYRRPPALDYTPYPRYQGDEEARAVSAAELAKMRTGIAQIPGAVTRVDDGFGGTRPNIDWTRFSEAQERDYKRLIEHAEEH